MSYNIDDYLAELAGHGDEGAKFYLHAGRCYDELLAALENLVDRDLIKDKDNDHYDEVMEVIAKAKKGEKENEHD